MAVVVADDDDAAVAHDGLLWMLFPIPNWEVVATMMMLQHDHHIGV